MPETPSSRALVVKPHARIIDRLDRMVARYYGNARSGAVQRSTYLPGVHLIVSPDESRAAIPMAAAWSAALQKKRSERALVLDYAWERDGLTAHVDASLETGLRDILNGSMMREDLIIRGKYCDFLPLGCAVDGPPSTIELQRFQYFRDLLKASYKNVIIISENPLRLREVVELGGLTDGAIFAVELNRSERAALESAKSLFERQGVPVHGALVWRGREVIPAWLSRMV